MAKVVLKKNHKSQGLFVIGLLIIATLGLSAVYAGIRASEKTAYEQVVQHERELKEITNSDTYEGAAFLGTLGHVDDPKFANIVDKIKDANYQGSVLLVRDGKPVWQQGFGESAPGVAFDPDMPIAIASMTKNVTAYLVVKEFARQNISLDTPVSNFYPNLAGASQTTIRDLLRMDAPYDGCGYAENTMSEEEYMAYYLNGLTYAPRATTKWKYNAADYQLLTNILYTLTGVPYQEMVEQELSSKYEVLNAQDFNQMENRPVGINKSGHEVIFDPQKFEREIGTGCLFMSSWHSYQFVRDQIQGKNLTKAEFADLTKPRPEKATGYVGGMYVTKYGYKMHGIMQGFEPSMIMDKTGKNAVVMFSNRCTSKIDDKVAEPIFKELMSMK